MSGVRIILDDFRAAGICPRARLWFDRHGLDWRDFVRNGISPSELRATGDHLDLIARLEDIARARTDGKE
jgi:hypothetical protein